MLYHHSELCASEGRTGVLLDLSWRTRLIWMKITSKISSLITSCYDVSREKGSSGPLAVSLSPGQFMTSLNIWTYGLCNLPYMLLNGTFSIPEKRDTSKLSVPSLIMQILLSWSKLWYVQVIGISPPFYMLQHYSLDIMTEMLTLTICLILGCVF